MAPSPNKNSTRNSFTKKGSALPTEKADKLKNKSNSEKVPYGKSTFETSQMKGGNESRSEEFADFSGVYAAEAARLFDEVRSGDVVNARKSLTLVKGSSRGKDLVTLLSDFRLSLVGCIERWSNAPLSDLWREARKFGIPRTENFSQEKLIGEILEKLDVELKT